MPEEIVPYFCGARLIALNKKSGGIRPIAVGSTLRRLCGKICNSMIQSEALGIFRPKQLGYGVKGGAEAAVHAVQKIMTSGLNSGYIMLKIDFENAFNTIDRDHFLELVRTEFPDIYPFVYMCYSDSSSLLWRGREIRSESGVQQGDPLGPFLFCLGIHQIVKNMMSKFNIWYLDDGCLIGDPTSVFTDFQTIIEMGKKIGLKVNLSKCEVFMLDGNGSKNAVQSTLEENDWGVQIRGFEHAVLLGGAFHDDAIPGILKEKLEDLETMVERLKMIGRHEALFLLRNCFVIPKLTYMLRTTLCHAQSILGAYDHCIHGALEFLLNCNLSGMSRDRATMPIRYGGLGIRRATEIALPAFLSSCKATKKLQDEILGEPSSVPGAPEVWDESCWLGMMGEKPDGNSEGAQRAWDEIQCRQKYSALLSGANSDTTKASIMASCGPKSGAWLHAIPIDDLGLKLTDEQVRIAAALRIGATVCEQQRCVCGAMIEKDGLHPLACGKVQGRQARHHDVNSILQRALNSAQVPSVLEPQGLSRDDGKRPDGMTLIPWENGRSAIWDFTCVDTTADSNLPSSVTDPGKAANVAESKKVKKYSALSGDYIFIPVAVETLGSWGKSGINFVKKIGIKMCERNGDTRAGEFLTQRMSIAVQRGNATCISSAMRIGIPMKTYDDAND